MAFETELSIKADIVMIQELFIGNQETYHTRFNFYRPQKDRQKIRVMTEIKKNLADKMIMSQKNDLIKYPYFVLLEICKFDARSEKPGRKTQVINMFDNQVRNGFTLNVGIY